MRRSTSLGVLAALCLCALPVRSAHAQNEDDGRERGPRFLLVGEKGGSPLTLDASRTPLLRQRLALDLVDVPLKQALSTLAQRSGLQLVYSDDVLPSGARVTLRAEQI